MLFLLFAAYVQVETGTGLENLPADPVKAWAVIATVFVMAVAPVLKARIDGRKNATEEKTPPPSVVIAGSVTPHIDASQALLATVVGSLQAEHDELAKHHIQLVRDVARYELKVEQLEARVRELESENNVLHGRLMGRS